ncbi:MAG: helix-turn-helix domain-containing protein [Ferruginibacter sp.]
MITVTEIAPAPVLAPFVRCYSLREFDTNGSDLVKPWHALHEISINFHFKALPCKLNNPQTGQILKKGNYGGIMGLGTQFNGELTFNGSYSFFEIYFKPNGFNKIFGLPASEINNLLVFADDIFEPNIKLFFEQLCIASGLNEMALLADAYLLLYLKKQKHADHKDAITHISNLIFKKAGCVNIDLLAYDANMSVRNFERRFIEQVGISPKLFCCVTRFNHAFAMKLKNPEMNWTSIGHKSGYFDQTHLIKDFKRFAGYAPLTFLKHTPLTDELYTNRVEV